MTKDQVELRIKQLETQREQVRNTLLAYEGAIQDCQFWLSEMDKPTLTEEVVKEEEIKVNE